MRELRLTYLAEKRQAIEGREEVITRMEKKEQENYQHSLGHEQGKAPNTINAM